MTLKKKHINIPGIKIQNSFTYQLTKYFLEGGLL